jgi:hypothetical protein
VNPYLHAGDVRSEILETEAKEAERELDAAPGRTALNAAAKKLMLAKRELKRLEQKVPAA